MGIKKRIINILFFMLYCGLILVFLLASGQDGNKSGHTSEIVVNIISNIFSIEKTDNLRLLVRKLVGHFGFNVILGIVSIIFYLTLDLIKNLKIKYIMHYLIGFLEAFISEFLVERNTSGRSASFIDVLIDFSGFILISTIILIIFNIKNNKKTL